jgi:putative FmdB family regulatory protein
MPLYDFKCPECGATVEKLQRFEDSAPLCHSCRDSLMERMPSAGTAWKFGGKHE